VDAGPARFALPNAAHRDRCVECQDVVEGALADYFKEPVRLELVVDDAVPAAGGTAAGRRPAARRATRAEAAEPVPEPPDDLGDDDYDPAGGEAVAVESLAEARLLEAFPGAQEVQE